MSLVRPATDLQFTQIEGGNPLQSAADAAIHSNMDNFDSSKRTKSPRAAPRPTKDTQLYPVKMYENLANFATAAEQHTEEIGVLGAGNCSGYSSSGSRGSSENDLIHHQLETIQSVDMIPDDLSSLSVPGLCDCLHLFELPNVGNKFKQNLIDGKFFAIMTEQMFKDKAFNFSEYELLKIRQLRDGWRPKL